MTISELQCLHTLFHSFRQEHRGILFHEYLLAVMERMDKDRFKPRYLQFLFHLFVGEAAMDFGNDQFSMLIQCVIKLLQTPGSAGDMQQDE